MIRKEKEKLADFIDRLRKMAKMAYHNIPDEVRRLELTESLIKSNIRRVLPASLKKPLDDRMRIHLSTGKPEMTCREVEKECIELERARDERKVSKSDSTSTQRVCQASSDQYGGRRKSLFLIRGGSSY